jgi:hypothetical protein
MSRDGTIGDVYVVKRGRGSLCGLLALGERHAPACDVSSCTRDG